MPGETQNRFLLLYGSQTGQAKAISEEICDKSDKEGLNASMCCLSHTERKFDIEKERCVVFVTSTTGDGEAPDTASKFVRRLKKKTLPEDHLAKLNYALLGLGDSNYTNFCNCAKTVDGRLQGLGAQKFYASGFADDAVGLEVVVEPWMDGLFPALRKFLDIPEPTDSDIPDTENVCISKTIPQTVTSSQADRRTLNDVSDGLESLSIDTQSNTGSSKTETRTKENNDHNNLIKEEKDKILDLNHENLVGSDSTNNCRTSTNTSLNNTDIVPRDVVCESLQTSVPPLCEMSLGVPSLPPAYLACTWLPETNVDLATLKIQNGCPLPSAACDVTMVTVDSARVLTRHDAIKKTLLISLNTKDSGLQYVAGDAVSIVCPNCPEEIDMLLDRLGLTSQADHSVELGVIPGTKKRSAVVPPHIPTVSTLRHIFTTCLDIRDQPKKALLRCMAEHTADSGEQRRLQELCSRQGSGDYSSYIREPRVSLLDVLYAFPSCAVPVERLLEHLPRLQPRPYSVCSCPETSPGRLDIVFNVVSISAGEGRAYPRNGVCTGWLDKMTLDKQTESEEGRPHPRDTRIPVFTRTNQHFRCPEDMSVPMILIGPGTGVSPFIGFLHLRSWQNSQSADGQTYGETMLFFGCRHRDRDYLFKKEFEDFMKNGILTDVFVSFSRDEQPENSPRYVHDNLRSQGEIILNLVETKDAKVYVCGDARNMAKDVYNSFIEMLKVHRQMSERDAAGYLMKMRLHRKYLEDVWT